MIKPRDYANFEGVRPAPDDRPEHVLFDLLSTIAHWFTDEELGRLAAWAGSLSPDQIADQLGAVIKAKRIQDPARRAGVMLRELALDPGEDPRGGDQATIAAFGAAAVFGLLSKDDQLKAVKTAQASLAQGNAPTSFDEVARAALGLLGANEVRTSDRSPLLNEILGATETSEGPSIGQRIAKAAVTAAGGLLDRELERGE